MPLWQPIAPTLMQNMLSQLHRTDLREQLLSIPCLTLLQRKRTEFVLDGNHLIGTLIGCPDGLCELVRLVVPRLEHSRFLAAFRVLAPYVTI